MKALLRFRASFWMLTWSCVAVYGCVLPFNNVASGVLMERDYFKPNSSSPVTGSLSKGCCGRRR